MMSTSPARWHFLPPVGRGVWLLSAVALLLLPSTTTADPGEPVICGEHILYSESLGETPSGGLKKAAGSTRKDASLVLIPGAGLVANQQALDTYRAAVALWELALDDDVQVVIQGDLISLPQGVLGSTQPRVFSTAYNDIRNAVVQDAAPNEGIASALPTVAQVTILTPGSPFTFNGSAKGTKANLKALGFDMSFDDANPDAVINFNSNFSFDYDPSDGISPGLFDFEAVVVHEIGHALGFISEVDNNEADIAAGTQAPEVIPSSLDMFRMAPGDGAINFTSNPRLVSTGTAHPTHVFYDGGQDLNMSTGVDLGDGRQAAHWKADELSGTYLGIMDPSLSPGQREVMTQNDLRAFGLIGWDIDPAVPVETISWGRLRQLLGQTPDEAEASN